jgi:hypothetical protein
MNALRVAVLVALCAAAVAGCGGSSETAAPPAATPSPTVTVDNWAVQTCKGAERDASLPMIVGAKSSANDELAAMGVKAERTQDLQPIKDWCAKHVPNALASPDPTPS